MRMPMDGDQSSKIVLARVLQAFCEWDYNNEDDEHEDVMREIGEALWGAGFVDLEGKEITEEGEELLSLLEQNQ